MNVCMYVHHVRELYHQQHSGFNASRDCPARSMNTHMQKIRNTRGEKNNIHIHIYYLSNRHDITTQLTFIDVILFCFPKQHKQKIYKSPITKFHMFYKFIIQ